MAKIYKIPTYFGDVDIISSVTGYLAVKCDVTGVKGRSYVLTTGFITSGNYHPHVLGAAHYKLNINLTTKEGIAQMKNPKVREELRNIVTPVFEQEIGDVQQQIVEKRRAISDMIVTTGDLKERYKVLGPVYFQVSNKGIFSSQLGKMINKHAAALAEMKANQQIGNNKFDWGFLYGEFSAGQNDFDKAFFVAVQELKERAAILGANAIIAVRQDIDLDTTNIQHFYLQMYGTAVELLEPHGVEPENEAAIEEDIQTN